MNRWKVTGRRGIGARLEIYLNAPTAEEAADRAQDPTGFGLDSVDSVEPDELREQQPATQEES